MDVAEEENKLLPVSGLEHRTVQAKASVTVPVVL